MKSIALSDKQDKNNGREMTVTGILFPSKFDRAGKVMGLVIDTPDQDDYLIENKGKGTELMAFIGSKVEVTGLLRENERGDFFLRVKNYAVLSSVVGKAQKANTP